MILNKLLSEQITQFWDYIKYAAVVTNNLSESDIRDEFCNNLLINLLSDKYQCWMGISDDKEIIKGIAITNIYKDVGEISHLLISSLYVYEATNVQEQLMFLENIKKYAISRCCKDVVFYTSNPSIIKSSDRLGFVEIYKVFKSELGGD